MGKRGEKRRKKNRKWNNKKNRKKQFCFCFAFLRKASVTHKKGKMGKNNKWIFITLEKEKRWCWRFKSYTALQLKRFVIISNKTNTRNMKTWFNKMILNHNKNEITNDMKRVCWLFNGKTNTERIGNKRWDWKNKQQNKECFCNWDCLIYK